MKWLNCLFIIIVLFTNIRVSFTGSSVLLVWHRWLDWLAWDCFNVDFLLYVLLWKAIYNIHLVDFERGASIWCVVKFYYRLPKFLTLEASYFSYWQISYHNFFAKELEFEPLDASTFRRIWNWLHSWINLAFFKPCAMFQFQLGHALMWKFD